MKVLLLPSLTIAFTGFVTVTSAKAYTPEQIAVESKRANEFFDKCFDEFVAHHPQATADLAAELANVATLKRDFDFDTLDPQTQLSYKLFEREAERNAS